MLLAQEVCFSAAVRAERERENDREGGIEGGREGIKPTDRARKRGERDKCTDCVLVVNYTDITARFSFLPLYLVLLFISALLLSHTLLVKALPDSIEGPSGAVGSLLASASELEAALEWDNTAGRNLSSPAAHC